MTGKPSKLKVLGPEWLQISAIPEHLKVTSGSVLLPVFASVQPNRYPGSSLVLSQVQIVSLISLVLGVFEQQHGEYLKRR